jgi:DNA-binding transcriptional MerR regulator
MSARSYLSIGDVLTLLRQEFPDVTISKIRFLESQGLVNPERTPSGYRKFYEHDVERLRWVLRQQREHFLPLKVIKDRLDDDASGAERVEAAPAPAAEVEATPAAEPVLVGQRASTAGASAEPATVVTGIDTSGSGAHAAASPKEPVTPTPPTPVERAHRANLAAQPAREADTVPAANGTGNGSGGHSRPSGRSSSASNEPPATRSSRSASAAKASAASPPPAPAPAPAPSPSAAAAAAANDPAPASAVAGMGGASLSLAELTAACGLTEAYVDQLQEYGLIRATSVGGSPYFDEEALTVANVAAKFAEFGIEARHLRLYKNAADREAGFIEQIVIPMVRQRNPEARARAVHTADDLARLGQQLKGSLLRSGLRDLLNG